MAVANGTNSTGGMNISAGGKVYAANMAIAFSSGTNGTVTIEDAGSNLTIPGSLVIGRYGTGTLNIRNGATYDSAMNILGAFSSANGTVSVEGLNSIFKGKADIYIGFQGMGDLTISNGALVQTQSGTSYSYTTTGVIIPETVSTATVFIAKEAGSSGVLNIGAADGDVATAAGTLEAENIVFGDGTGTLVFNHTGTSYDFLPNIIGD